MEVAVMRITVIISIIVVLTCSVGCGTKKLDVTQDGDQLNDEHPDKASTTVLLERPESYPVGVPFVPGCSIYRMSDSLERPEAAKSVDHITLEYKLTPGELTRALEAEINPDWEVQKTQEELPGGLVTRITLKDDRRFVQLSIIPFGSSSILLVAFGDQVDR